jgi:K+-sensing histidine kinase KdpD
MHSGINTYIPRGLSSLEKRIDADKMNELKIESSIKMIKEGLNHTQKVYKSVYEFTNLVKEQVVLEKQKLNLKETLDKFVAKTAYSDKVTIDELIDSDVNDVLFCIAIDNIVKNGIKYNKSDDKKVKIYMDNEFLVVEDNGVGLTQEEFNKILDPKYERVNKDSDGLGIKISNAILQEHGFNIYCEKIENGTKIKIKIK